MQDIIRIHEDDNVAVALDTLSAGTTVLVGNREIVLTEDIPQGHKVAAAAISKGEAVIKYGSKIGVAAEDIRPGTWVHVHNVKTGLGDLLDYTYSPRLNELEPTEDAFFQGYRRKDGKVGVRNEIWIIPTVGCVNNVGMAIEKKAQRKIEGSIPTAVHKWVKIRRIPEEFLQT